MAKYKATSLICWIAVGAIVAAVQMNYFLESVAATVISILIGLGLIAGGLAFMAKPKEEEKEEREETFIGY